MMGTINCIYETPCGWCSKWDKKCDRKIGNSNSGIACDHTWALAKSVNNVTVPYQMIKCTKCGTERVMNNL